MENKIKIVVSDVQHVHLAIEVCRLINEVAKNSDVGIAKRTVLYIQEKITCGKSVLAFDGELLIGFCYIETWEHGKYVANSGLIVHPEYRGSKQAYRIKKKIFQRSKYLYPTAKIFGITTSNAVLKINSRLGYRPVSFSELTQDIEFWNGCQGCSNYDILQRTNREMCLCTGMLFENDKNELSKIEKEYFENEYYSKR